MFQWDEENIRWMDAAAEYTGYYEELCLLLEPYISRNQKVCEVGCGLGDLACAVAKKVAHLTAIDIHPLAAKRAIKKSQDRKIQNMEVLQEDWVNLVKQQENRKKGSFRKFDCVYFSYISAIRKNWEDLKKLTDGPIIGILANGESGLGLNSRMYEKISVESDGRDTIWNVVPFLEARNVPYHLIECELEYGQPLRDEADAKRYLERYYKGNEKEMMDKIKHCMRREENQFYLPKQKKSGILIIGERS